MNRFLYMYRNSVYNRVYHREQNLLQPVYFSNRQNVKGPELNDT